MNATCDVSNLKYSSLVLKSKRYFVKKADLTARARDMVYFFYFFSSYLKNATKLSLKMSESDSIFVCLGSREMKVLSGENLSSRPYQINIYTSSRNSGLS